MGKLDFVYKGQTFLKVKPTDNTKAVNEAEKDLELIAEQYAFLFSDIATQQITSDVPVAKEKLDKLEDLKKRIINLKVAAELEKVDTNGMDHFWRMDFNKSFYYLTSIPNSKKEAVIMNMFPTLDAVSKEYKSLEDITKEKFIGKKYVSYNGVTAYVLYEYDEGFLGIVINDDNVPLGPAIGFKTDGVVLKYIDENIPELDNMDYIYDYVYHLKRSL